MAGLKEVFVFLTLSSFFNSFASAIIQEKRFKRGLFDTKKGMVLSGHVIATHHVVSPIGCSFQCTTNTQCLSYNYKPKGAGDKDVCELNNATRKTNPESYQADASYIHYYDGEIEKAKSCLDYLRSGLTENGIYTVTDRSGDSYKVWCDLSSEPRSAWTLILSYAHKNRHDPRFCTVTYRFNKPAHEGNPNWELYRQTLPRMQDISNHSSHLRITSSFPVYGVDYRDYMRAKLSSIDILSFVGGLGTCLTVENIDIRGIKETNTTVLFWQENARFVFHTDSSRKDDCDYDAKRGSVNDENNFGHTCIRFNPATRGSENDESTIQYWFGGYL